MEGLLAGLPSTCSSGALENDVQIPIRVGIGITLLSNILQRWIFLD